MTRDEIYKAGQTLIEDKDLFAASEYLLGLEDGTEIAEAFKNIVVDSHFKAKSTEQVLHFGNAGIHFCLTRALAFDGNDDEAARKHRLAAKALATDVASFTWPGWQEPDVAISPEQMAQGLVLARYSVRQLHELEPTIAQLGFTYWFLGGATHRQWTSRRGHNGLSAGPRLRCSTGR